MDKWTENTIKSEVIYEGRILNLRLDTVELPNQKYSKREIVEHNRSVGLIVLDGDQLFLIRQYRKAINELILEIPAGIVNDGESPRDAALREMQEEIGYASDQLDYLFEAYSSPGFTNERISFFYTDQIYESSLAQEDDEILEVVKLPFDEVLELIEAGEILDAKTIMACTYLKCLGEDD